MNLVYLDEVKFQPAYEAYYWLCALAIPEEDIGSVEDALSSLAKDYFNSSALDSSTEFHAVDIVHGKGSYKGRDSSDRIELLKKLANIIDSHVNIGRIVIRLDPSRMNRQDYHHIAFMFLVERVEQLMASRASKALLIADHDKQTVIPNVRSLASFKDLGTDFQFGCEIKHVVDTVHHTHSDHSRLLQLSDLYAYAMSLREKASLNYPKTALVDHVNALSNFTWPTKYKYWPAPAAT